MADTATETTKVEEQGKVDESKQQQEDKPAAANESQAKPEAEADEITVTIGDDPPPSEEDDSKAPEWVRDLRKSNRELARQNRELQQRLQTTAPAHHAAAVGPKPTMGDEDVDYDAEKFAAKLEKWHERKRGADAQAEAAQKVQRDAQAAWQATLNTFETEKSALKVKDFAETEELVNDALSLTQRGIILHAINERATMYYALGKNPKKLKELASITDPVKFAVAAARLETQLKVTQRKTPPPPEQVPEGHKGIALSSDQKLAQLEAEAERTGDRSKIIAYNREQRQRRAA